MSARRPRRQPGERFGQYTLVRRDEGGFTWTVECDCGTRRSMQLTALTSGRVKQCRAAGRHVVGIPSYLLTHQWLRRDRGRASERQCVDCGGAAREWSYDNCDENELISDLPESLGCKYSLKQEHYVPRCKPCHELFDRAHQSEGSK